MIRGKTILHLALVIGLASVVVYLNIANNQPVEVFDTVEVKRSTIVDELTETGTVEYVRTVDVKSTIPGEVQALLASVGDLVERDDLLALIRPDRSQALQISQRKAAVSSARIDLLAQKRVYQREKELYERSLISLAKLEQTERLYKRSENQLQLALLELDILLAETNSGESDKGQDLIRIPSPLTGIVVQRYVEVGEVIASGIAAFTGGTSLYHIGDFSAMLVKSEISEIDIDRVELGQQVEITLDAFPNSSYNGVVQKVAPIGQKKPGSNLVTFTTEIRVLNDDSRLKQGMSCDVDIIIEKKEHVMVLPVEALFISTGDKYANEDKSTIERQEYVVYEVKSLDSQEAPPSSDQQSRRYVLDSFSEKRVIVGIETNQLVEIVSGLSEGQRIAIDPYLVQRRLNTSTTESLHDHESTLNR